MKTILAVISFLFIAATSFATGVEGKWSATIKGPDGNGMELTFVFKMDGAKLTGVIKSPNGDMEISNTKIDGKEFSFEISFNDTTIKNNCILNDDDTITMKVVGSPMGDAEVILKRQKTD